MQPKLHWPYPHWCRLRYYYYYYYYYDYYYYPPLLTPSLQLV